MVLLVLLLCGLMVAVPGMAVATSAGECPNEQLREEALVNQTTGRPYSTELSDCRAYELVSPSNTEGLPALSFDSGNTEGLPQGFLEWDQITPGGAVYWFSRATPTEAGAIPDGRSLNIFVSRRTATGWTSHDLTPSPTVGDRDLIAGSPEGSAALILTQTSLSPYDQDNPFNGQGGVPSFFDIYRVGEHETPTLVTHGPLPRVAPPNPSSESIDLNSPVVFNPQLSAVGFVSTAPMATGATPGFRDCYVWASSDARLAALTNPENGSPEQRNCELLGIMPDGRPIFMDLSGDSEHDLIFVGNGSEFPIGQVTPVQLSAPTSALTSFNGIAPDGDAAYVTTPYALADEERDGETNIFRVAVPRFPQDTLTPPGTPGSENTALCVTCQVGGGGSAIFVGQSPDGSHVFFSIGEGAGEPSNRPYRGLWSWDSKSSIAVHLTTASDVEQLISSRNGEYVIGVTRQLAVNPHGTADIYEFSATLSAPRLITPGTKADTYRLAQFITSHTPPTMAGVSNNGQRVIYDDLEPGIASRERILEWAAGETTQLSPEGATSSYYVLGTAGPELEDIFFAAHEPLVASDLNAGTQTIYDARVDGGVSAPTQGVTHGTTPDPVAPLLSPYTSNLATSSSMLSQLPADTSYQTVIPKKNINRCKRGFAIKHDRCVRVREVKKPRREARRGRRK